MNYRKMLPQYANFQCNEQSNNVTVQGAFIIFQNISLHLFISMSTCYELINHETRLLQHIHYRWTYADNMNIMEDIMKSTHDMGTAIIIIQSMHYAIYNLKKKKTLLTKTGKLAQ